MQDCPVMPAQGGSGMKRRRYTEEQAISILNEHEAGASVKGGQGNAILYSPFGTARACGPEPYAGRRHLCTELPESDTAEASRHAYPPTSARISSGAAGQARDLSDAHIGFAHL